MNERHIEVMQQYCMDVKDVYKGRGAWICSTENGLVMLREYRGTEKRLSFELEVLKELAEICNNKIRFETYYMNKEEHLISIADDGTKLMVKSFYTERECNLRDKNDLYKAVSSIAFLHKALRKIPFKEQWSMGSTTATPIFYDMERHNRELKRTRNFISKKRNKNEFELCVMKNFEEFYDQALEACSGMKRMEQSLDADSKTFLCHGELNQHHILMGTMYPVIVEFGKMHMGYQVIDLYYFIRKVMEKNDWDIDTGIQMLNIYDQILPFSKNDRDQLHYLFLYPEKYWKQLNFYFNGKKAWVSDKSIEKMRKLEAQQQQRNKFLLSF